MSHNTDSLLSIKLMYELNLHRMSTLLQKWRQKFTTNRIVKMVKLKKSDKLLKNRHIISVMSQTSFFFVLIGDPAMSRSS